MHYLQLNKNSEDSIESFFHPLNLKTSDPKPLYIESILLACRCNPVSSDPSQHAPRTDLFTHPPEEVWSIVKDQPYYCFQWNDLIFPKEAEPLLLTWLILHYIFTEDQQKTLIKQLSKYKSARFDPSTSDLMNNVDQDIPGTMRIIMTLCRTDRLKKARDNPSFLLKNFYPDLHLQIRQNTSIALYKRMVFQRVLKRMDVLEELTDQRNPWTVLQITEKEYEELLSDIQTGIDYFASRTFCQWGKNDSDPLTSILYSLKNMQTEKWMTSSERLHTTALVHQVLNLNPLTLIKKSDCFPDFPYPEDLPPYMAVRYTSTVPSNPTASTAPLYTLMIPEDSSQHTESDYIKAIQTLQTPATLVLRCSDLSKLPLKQISQQKPDLSFMILRSGADSCSLKITPASIPADLPVLEVLISLPSERCTLYEEDYIRWLLLNGLPAICLPDDIPEFEAIQSRFIPPKQRLNPIRKK